MANIFTWVFDMIKDFRTIFIRVLLISIILNLLSLAMPVAMMAITDRVIVYQGFSTLQILLLGLFILNFFEVILSFIRTYLLTHTSLCISLETSVKIYEKLLSLKIEYFDNKPVGKTMNLLQEVHHIKDFLIDAPITIIIDIIFAVIFLFVIFSIESALSLVVLLIIPVHIGVSILVTHLREFYLKEQFRIASLNQSSLVETISSIQTVKLMSIEQSLKNLWISQTNKGADISFKIIKIESIANLFTSFFDKFSNILILYIGANKVMHNEITLENKLDNLQHEKERKIYLYSVKQKEREVIGTKLNCLQSDFLYKAHYELDNLKKNKNLTLQTIEKLKHSISNMNIKSPITGYVENLKIYNIMGVIASGEEVMNIVPLDAQIKLEANLHSRDIGFVKTGHKVAIKLDAFPYTQYGTLKGKVCKIANDSFSSDNVNYFYKIDVCLEKDYLSIKNINHKINLGYTAQIDIYTDQRKIIDFFLSPIKIAISNSFKEK